jgi:sulfur carrier protein
MIPETGCQSPRGERIVCGGGIVRCFKRERDRMDVVINGQTRAVSEGLTIRGLLESLGLEPGRMAVELDGEIVKAPEWPARRLEAGSRLEIVHFVGGG